MNTETDFDIDAALESGDPELMDKALAALEGQGAEVFDKQDEEEADTGFTFGDKAEEKTPEIVPEENPEEADSGASSAHEDGKGGDEAVQVVKTKDGKNEIPYEVLESTRLREQKAREEADELRRQLSEANAKIQESEQRIQYAKANMEQHGVDADAAFTDPDAITEKEVQEAEEDFGKNSGYAKSVRAMFKLQQQQASNVQQAEAVAESQQVVDYEEVNSAIASNESLTSWQMSDPARWKKAILIDNQLRADPAWNSRPMSERFAEVVKQTKTAFGDDKQPESAAERAKQIIDKTDASVPDSLSDLGQAPVQVKSDAEALKDMSPEQLEAAMENMTQDQLDRLFASGF